MKKLYAKIKDTICKLFKVGQWGLAERLTAQLLVTFMIVSCISSIILVMTKFSTYVKNHAAAIHNISHTVADVIDTDRLLYYYYTGDSEYLYFTVADKLRKSVGEYIDSSSIYVMVPEDDGIYLVYGVHHNTGEIYPLGTKFAFDESDNIILPDIKAGICSEGINYISHKENEYLLSAWAPIFDEEHQVIAFVEIDSHFDVIVQNFIKSMGHPVINTMIVFVLILLILIYALRRSVTNPLSRLTEYIKSYSDGEFKKEAPVFENEDEIKYLADSFRMMEGQIKEYIKISNENAVKQANMNTELAIANGIQSAMLETDFPEREEFSMYALMNPAAYVGGDFYDYFYIDDDHLALVIADVSGGNVSGAMFMMRSMTNIKNWTLGIKDDPAKILSKVNDELCNHNSEAMFVTVWLGIMEISTGKIICANAGHEYPIIARDGRDFEVFTDDHGFVLGGMEGLSYTNYEIKLSKGDTLYVYTDGVPECLNEADEQYTMETLVHDLNALKGESVQDILEGIATNLTNFMGTKPQYDDITMLGIRYER